MSREIYNYKREAIKVAKQLEYPTEIIARLQKATTETEICTAMTTARQM
jgi:hypothetical protein